MTISLPWPSPSGKISLRDLKACKLTSIFFNTFINVEKYLEYEQRDPVSAAKVRREDNDGWNEPHFHAGSFLPIVREMSLI